MSIGNALNCNSFSDTCPDFIIGLAVYKINFVFHMAEERFHGGIVPIIPPARHELLGDEMPRSRV